MIKQVLYLSILFIIVLSGCKDQKSHRKELAAVIDKSIRTELLDPWYPFCLDTTYGGFLSTFTYDFKHTGDQDKMIVTQARHTWTNAKASLRYPKVEHFKTGATHGFHFLRDVMWDKTYGGFYTLVDQQGNPKNIEEGKVAYGNSFGIYALTATEVVF